MVSHPCARRRAALRALPLVQVGHEARRSAARAAAMRLVGASDTTSSQQYTRHRHDTHTPCVCERCGCPQVQYIESPSRWHWRASGGTAYPQCHVGASSPARPATPARVAGRSLSVGKLHGCRPPVQTTQTVDTAPRLCPPRGETGVRASVDAGRRPAPLRSGDGLLGVPATSAHSASARPVVTCPRRPASYPEKVTGPKARVPNTIATPGSCSMCESAKGRSYI